jgi:type II secretory pathway pseudopilin PulG
MLAFKNKQSRGDTIVEVLLSIAIVGLAIASSYGLAGRSLRTGVLATERTQANKMAESQVEALVYRERQSSADVWTTNFGNINNFCLDINPGSQLDSTGALNPKWTPINNTGSTPDNLVIAGATSGYDPACVDSSGKYYMNATTHNNNDGQGTTYLFTVRWLSIASGATASSQLYYRLPDAQAAVTPTLPPPPPPPPPPACSYNYLAIALDHSYDMGKQFSKNVTRMQVAQDVAKNLAQNSNLNPGGTSRASLSSYGGVKDPVRTVQPMTSSYQQIVAAANSVNAITATRQPNNYTNTAGGLNDTFNQLKAQPSDGSKIAVVMGDDWMFAKTEAQTLAVANQMAANGIRIYAIGMFDKNDASARAFFTEITRNGGYYIWGGDTASLDSLYASLAAGVVGTCT